MWPFKPKAPRPPALEGVSISIKKTELVEYQGQLLRKLPDGRTLTLSWRLTHEMAQVWGPVLEELQKMIDQMEDRSDSP